MTVVSGSAEQLEPPASGGLRGRITATATTTVSTTVSTVRSYRAQLELLWRAAPLAATSALILTLVGAAASTAGIVLLGRVVGVATAAARDGAGAGAAGGVLEGAALTWMILLAVSFVIPPVSGAIVNVLAQHIMSAAVARVGALTSELASSPTGLEQLEDPTAARRLHRMVQAIGEWTYLEGIAATWTVLQTRLSGVGAFAVLVSWHWWAAVVLAVGYLATGRALTAWLLSIFADMALEPPIERRRASYLYDVLMKGAAAKEIRSSACPAG